VGFSNRALELIADSYTNLKYLNLCDDWSGGFRGFRAREMDDEGLTAITDSCYKLEYLNISNRTEFSEISIYNQMRQQHRAGERILTPEWWYSTDLSMRDNRMRRRHRA
ncbi:17929_t:CDS:2, partial [Funneliformis geosporum]